MGNIDSNFLSLQLQTTASRFFSLRLRSELVGGLGRNHKWNGHLFHSKFISLRSTRESDSHKHKLWNQTLAHQFQWYTFNMYNKMHQWLVLLTEIMFLVIMVSLMVFTAIYCCMLSKLYWDKKKYVLIIDNLSLSIFVFFSFLFFFSFS